MLMAIAKCIYLPVTYDTKEGYSNGRKKKKGLQYSFLLLLFCVICLYLSFSAFLLVGSDGKVARIKMISNTKLHV